MPTRSPGTPLAAWSSNTKCSKTIRARISVDWRLACSTPTGCGKPIPCSAKGKIERFFRRVRDQFLIRNLDLSSLGELNKQFTHWVEQDYNATVHSTLGMKPIDRFGVDLSRIRFLSPSQDTDELFYAQETRTVKKDNTFSFQGKRYETPVDLRGKEIAVRYERHRQGAVIVYDNERRLGQARLLDAVANGLARRREQ